MVLGQRVGLELVEDLQAVLDGAQVDEGIAEKAAERGREIAALGEAEDGAQRVLLAEPRIVPPVEELERLHEELDLADAADAELDVAALGVLAAERAVDGALHPADLPHDGGVEPRPEHEGPDQLGEAAGDRGIAGAEAGLDERLPLPGLRAIGHVGAVALEGQDEGAYPALGPEPEVHAEGVALVGHRLERAHDGAHRLGEELAVGHAPGFPTRRPAVLAVDEDQVDVRGIIELVPAQLAHPDHRESRGHPVGADRNTVETPEPVLGPAPRRAQTHVGQAGQLLRRHRQVGVAQDVAAADPQQLAVLEAPQRVEPRVVTGEGPEARVQILLQLVAVPLPHGRRLEEPWEQGGMAAQGVREELAGAAEARQQRRRAGMGSEEAQEGGAVPLPGEALEIVESHVGVGRCRQLGEEPWHDRRQQLGLARRRGERVEVLEGAGRIGEASPPEAGERATVMRRRRQQAVELRLLRGDCGHRGT